MAASPFSELGSRSIAGQTLPRVHIFGEPFPKRIALHDPERVSTLVAPLMTPLAPLVAPIVWVLEISTERVPALLRLADRPVRVIMPHRTDIVWADRRDRPRELAERLGALEHARYPVCDASIDRPVGVVHAKRCAVQVWAYCLMPDHVHVVMVPRQSDGLHRSLAGAHRRYTRHINFREGWRGYLWQGRFASTNGPAARSARTRSWRIWRTSPAGS